MADNLFELFSPPAIAAYWTQVQSNLDPYLGETFFPARKKAGLDLKWFKGHKGLPVVLMASAFDALPTFRDRPGIQITETNMPFYREGFKIKEEDRQELLRISEANDPYLDQILANVFDDAQNLLEGANAAAERERMQLLFPVNGNAGISVKANGVDYTYNYDSDGAWKTGNYFALTGTALWTAPATADPFNDIRKARKAVAAKTGSTPSIAVMNSTTFNLLPQVTAIKNRFLSTSGLTVGYISDEEARRILRDTVGVDVVVYDKQYKDESGTVQSYVPDNYVALLPNRPVGSTWYGVTPEEADLRGGRANGSVVSIVNTGVAIHQRIESGPPVNVNTYASQIVLPSYEGMDEVALIKVA